MQQELRTLVLSVLQLRHSMFRTHSSFYYLLAFTAAYAATCFARTRDARVGAVPNLGLLLLLVLGLSQTRIIKLRSPARRPGQALGWSCFCFSCRLLALLGAQIQSLPALATTLGADPVGGAGARTARAPVAA